MKLVYQEVQWAMIGFMARIRFGTQLKPPKAMSNDSYFDLLQIILPKTAVLLKNLRVNEHRSTGGQPYVLQGQAASSLGL
jgi:hypothetical protein